MASDEHSVGPLTTKTWIRFKKYKVKLEEERQKKVTNDETLNALLDLAEAAEISLSVLEVDEK